MKKQNTTKCRPLDRSRWDKTDVMLVVCGGVQVVPKCLDQLKIKVDDCEVSVPTLVVSEQRVLLILGTNVIKNVLIQLRQYTNYCHAVNRPESTEVPELNRLNSSLTCCLVSTDGEVMRCQKSLELRNWYSCHATAKAGTPSMGQITSQVPCFRG